MAKGKKNKKGSEKEKTPIESAVSSLTLASQSEASTSQGEASTSQAGASTSQAQADKDQPTTVEKAKDPETSTVPKPGTTKEKEVSQPAQEEESGGLGLTGYKKSKRKKKPNLAQAEAQAQADAKASSATIQAHPVPTPSASAQGLPSAQQGPPQVGQGPPPVVQGPQQTGHGPPPVSQVPPQWQGQRPPHAGQVPSQWQGQRPPIPTQQWRGQAPPPGSQAPPHWHGQGPPSAVHGPPQGPPPGWRGQTDPAAAAAAIPTPTSTRAPPQQSAQSRPIPTPARAPPQQSAQSRPIPTPARAPPQQSAQPSPVPYTPPAEPRTPSAQAVAAYGQSKQEAKCRFTIPAKIPGNSVRTIIARVITNYLPMTVKPIKVCRYDVAFEPSRPKKMIPAVFNIIKKQYYPNEFIAFDQVKNCYTLKPMKNVGNVPSANKEEIKFKVDYKDQNDRVMQFEVVFKMTGVIDLARLHNYMKAQGSSLNPPSDAIQCVDVVLRQGALESYIRSGRQFFKRPERPVNLGQGLEMWTGLFQSALFTSNPYINIDVAHKGFPICQSFLDAWKSFNLDPSKPIEQQMGRNADGFKDLIKNIRVVCKLVGPPAQTREYIINGLVDKPANIFFENDQAKRKMSVLEYYTTEKKYKLQYPNLNCVWVGPRNKTIYFPMELVSVAYGQPSNKQLNEFQLSTMVKEAATPPYQRLQKITEVTRNMNYNNNTFFKAFGLEISNKFLEVDAKVLAPPVLAVGEGTAMPRNGSWNAQKLLKPEALTAWGFFAIDLGPDRCNFEEINKLILQTGNQLGMVVKPAMMTTFNIRVQELRNHLLRAAEMNIRVVFIVVSQWGKDNYHRVKQLAECDVGILTQCIREQTATRRMNGPTMKNILLKVNSKLMGINQSLNSNSIPRCLQAGGVMVVGADVTHPAPDSNIPSIAAVTASMDPKCFIYNIEMSIQEPKSEIILQFEEMMADHFKVYMERNNRVLPKKIYVFRDGVSEGQFSLVLDNELAGMLRAYSRFSKEKPEVLFLLVQKRHHTRLFGQDKTKGIVNVSPGTVVDTQIVHSKELDFYLVSHQAIKGTARPTRYHAVCNDGKIPSDEVEQLAFYLCHLYSRCMRSVSYPTPTYYAHLACLRARSLTYQRTFDIDALRRQPQRLRVLDKMLRSSRMFFV